MEKDVTPLSFVLFESEKIERGVTDTAIESDKIWPPSNQNIKIKVLELCTFNLLTKRSPLKKLLHQFP